MSGSHDICIIGFGNMGRALARGLLRNNQARLFVCDKSGKPTDEELGRWAIPASGLTWCSPDQPAPSPGLGASGHPVTFVLATKPQNLEAVLTEWRTVLEISPADSVLISILAGIPTSAIESLLPKEMPVVRAMPNIAATVDQAATVICPGRLASAQHLATAKTIFDAVGKTWTTSEEHLNAVTGLSGSGPAYIYMVIEALSDGGVKMGLSRQLSLELATQTVIGAGILVRETRTHPAVLRDQVTTPGGTTISAIHELERHGLRSMLIQAVVTATRKSNQLLAKTLGKGRTSS